MIIDECGRLFGRVNLIDAICLTFVLLLVPLAYTSWFLFRMPAPKVIEVTPSTVTAGQPSRIELRGEHFRPYMRVRLGDNLAEFFLESPIRGEVRVSALAPGRYDLSLFDEAQILVRIPDAVTVSAPVIVAPPEPVEYRVYLSVRLSAQVARIAQLETTLDEVTDRHVTALLALGDTPDGGLDYRGQRVRIGEPIQIDFARFIIRGIVTRIESAGVAHGPVVRFD